MTGTAGTSSEQSITTFAGMLLKVGAMLSSTVMVCIAEVLFPQASVAVQVLTNTKLFGQVPVCNCSLNSTFTSIQLSVAVTTGASGTNSEHSTATVKFVGKPTNAGIVLSLIVIVCV